MVGRLRSVAGMNKHHNYYGLDITNISSVEEEGLEESHPFYKNIPKGIFGSTKPKSAEQV